MAKLRPMPRAAKQSTPTSSLAGRKLLTLLALALAGCATVQGEATEPVVETPVVESPAASRAPAGTPSKAPARTPRPVAESARKAHIPAAPALIPEPPLDIAALKLRLRETKALNTLTKLSLSGQMDDLIERFRAIHQGGQTSTAALRAPFDELVMKVLALLQKDDPGLARSIAGSREAIWQILADPKKFHSVS